MLNYFTTLDAGGATTAIGLAPRGANTAAEFERQTDKLVNFIATLDADVLGLTELENDFFDSNRNDSDPEGNAIEYLVEQLNARLGADIYAWVNPGSQLDSGQFVGGDAIAVGFIYKPSEVQVSFGTTIQNLDDSDAGGRGAAGQSTIGHIFNGVNTSRAALAVTFEEIATDDEFTAVINHFKSKSGNGTGVDADQGDGQGAWQNQRELAAQALTQWIATHPTGTSDDDVLLLGDLNAYLKEDTIDPDQGGRLPQPGGRTPQQSVFLSCSTPNRLARSRAGSNSLAGQVTGIDGMAHQCRRGRRARLQSRFRPRPALLRRAQPGARVRPRPGRHRAGAHHAEPAAGEHRPGDAERRREQQPVDRRSGDHRRRCLPRATMTTTLAVAHGTIAVGSITGHRGWRVGVGQRHRHGYAHRHAGADQHHAHGVKQR